MVLEPLLFVPPRTRIAGEAPHINCPFSCNETFWTAWQAIMDRLKTFDAHELWLALQATDKYDVLRVTAALSIAYFMSTCIYSRYFHPLAQFPGPFLASITNLYQVWLYLHVGAEHLVDEDLHRRYGSVVRKGPNFLSVNDASVTMFRGEEEG
jgi:hypothetical protein